MMMAEQPQARTESANDMLSMMDEFSVMAPGERSVRDTFHINESKASISFSPDEIAEMMYNNRKQWP